MAVQIDVAKWGSRKLWLTLIGGAVIIWLKQSGWDSKTLGELVALIIAYLGANAYEKGKTNGGVK
jgi:hypothetical protein